MAIRITCVDKISGNIHDSHEAINHYGWIEDGTGSHDVWPRQRMVDWVKKGGVAYVLDRYGNKVGCYRRTSINGTEFLQTVTDDKYTDNLLNLPKCR